MGSKAAVLPVQITRIKSAFLSFITVTYVWEVCVCHGACVSVRGQLWELVLSPLDVLRGWDSSHPRHGSRHLFTWLILLDLKYFLILGLSKY